MTDQKNTQAMKGLTTEQAKTLQEKFGKNELTLQKKQSFFIKTFHIICEPMFLLLIAAASVLWYEVVKLVNLIRGKNK